MIEKQMMKARGITFQAEKTNKKRDIQRVDNGDENSRSGTRRKASNAATNAFWNRTYNEIRARERRRIATEFIQQQNPELVGRVLDEINDSEELKGIINDIVTKERPELFNHSIKDVIDSIRVDDGTFKITLPVFVDNGIEEISFYIGETKQEGNKFRYETFGWTTYRGAHRRNRNGELLPYNGDRNQPVITNPDGTAIGLKKLEHELGFQSIILYQSEVMSNATLVEKLLQDKFQHLPLGLRLWKCSAKGPNHSLELGKYKVFMTFAFNLTDAVEEGTIIKL